MEIAIGLTGLGLTTLGIIFAYIWKSNGKLQEKMMASLEKMMISQEKMMISLEKMMSALERIEQGQKDIAQMLLNQTKILEKIEGKIK